MVKIVDTKFFKLLLDCNSSSVELENEFNHFYDELVACYSSRKELCVALKEVQRAFVTLIYVESKLSDIQSESLKVSSRSHFVQSVKVLLEFQMDTLKYLYRKGNFNYTDRSQSSYQWTGNKIDFVELAYALFENKSIYRGDIKIEKFVQDFGSFFGLEITNSSRHFTNIKQRKSDRRTFFLDLLTEGLEARMEKDDLK